MSYSHFRSRSKRYVTTFRGATTNYRTGKKSRPIYEDVMGTRFTTRKGARNGNRHISIWGF